jgi:hypothetical protein
VIPPAAASGVIGVLAGGVIEHPPRTLNSQALTSNAKCRCRPFTNFASQQEVIQYVMALEHGSAQATAQVKRASPSIGAAIGQFATLPGLSCFIWYNRGRRKWSLMLERANR